MTVRTRVADSAFERALEVASCSQNTTAVADALSALQKVVSTGGHPLGTLDRVVAVARTRMTTTDSAMVWQGAVQLALATGDNQLRAMIAQVAEGRYEPRFSARDQLRLWVRAAAQRALKRSALG